MSQSQAVLATENGSRYLQQLCKHWSHKFQAAFDAAQGRIDLGEGRVCEMSATPEQLTVIATAADVDALPQLQGVIAAHILRFAHREPDLAFDWRPLS